MARHKFAPYFMIVLAQLPILLKIYSWEPDQHHDGVMFAAAVAVREGKLPNKDVFAQYGPVTPWIQGIWLRLTSPTVLNMRILTVFFILGISILIYRLLQRFLSRKLALLTSFAWVLTGPFGLPWSSLITTFLTLLTIQVISEVGKRRASNSRDVLYVTASLCFVVGTFTRVHFVLIGIAVGIYLRLTGERLRIFRLNTFEIASFVNFSIFLMVFQYLGILKPYLQQCIFWAFGSYSTAPELSKSLVIDFLWIPAVGIFVIAMLYLLGNFANHNKFWVKHSPFLFVLFIYASSLVGSRLARTGEQTLRNPRILFIDASQKMLYGIGYSAITIFVIFTLVLLKRSQFKLKNFPLEFWVAAASLAQLYPFFDPHHVWFVTPTLMVALISIFPRCEMNTEQVFIKGASPLLLVAFTALFTQFWLNTTQIRYEYISPQMKGMESIWRSADEIDRTLILLNQFAIPESVQFECSDGLYAVANEKYLANSPMFVTWGPRLESTRTAKQLFACYLDRSQIQSYLDSGYSIIFKTEWQPLTYPNDRKYWNVLFNTL